MSDLLKLKELARRAEDGNKKFFARIRKNVPRNFDTIVQDIHEEVFDETDCLQCANCCKTTSPIFYQKDIERLAKHMKVKPSEFIEKYLHIDEDNDFVLNHAPCPFLASDNYCLVYDHRPNACREYPHTDRKKFHQLLDLTIKNSYICPAVFKIIERLKVELK